MCQASGLAKGESDDKERKIERGLFATVLSVLWLNGNSNGHTTFSLVPQLVDWLLFFGLAAVLMSNFLNSAIPRPASRLATSNHFDTFVLAWLRKLNPP